MKKLVLVLGVAAMFAMTSCSKDYTCECSDGTSVAITGKKSDAQTACDFFAFGSTTCELK